MKRSILLLCLGLVFGFASGVFVWQKQTGSRLREENNLLREKAGNTKSLRAQNAKFASEHIDPDELRRLRKGQTELLRLRGQVSQLRREVDETRATVNRAAAAKPQTAVEETDQSPIETFTAKAVGTVGHGQSLVTGGWKIESGKRVFVLMQPSSSSGDDTVLVRSQIVEVPEPLLASLGFEELKSDDSATTVSGIFSREDTAKLLANLKSMDGVNLISAPQVVTISGRQAQVAVIESHELPTGQTFSTGPVVDITPTISADKQAVELVVGAQLNVRRERR